MRGTLVQQMFDIICDCALLAVNGDVVKVWNLFRIFLLSTICLATLQINSTLVIIWLSSRISPTIRLDSQLAENRPDSRISGVTLSYADKKFGKRFVIEDNIQYGGYIKIYC